MRTTDNVKAVRRPDLDRALRLLRRVPLIDGHNDLAHVIAKDPVAQGDVATYDLGARRTTGDTDIPRLREGQIAAQFWAAFIPPKEPQPASYALQQIALLRRMHEIHAEVFLPALRPHDVARARRQRKIASFITIENGAALENRLGALDGFYDLGVRLMTLCHNATTDWCDSATDAPRHGGLSDFGKRVIARMNALGMIIDLAHVSDDVMHQAIGLSASPVVFSHSNARALCDHPRNVPDDVLDLVPARGALVMATFVPGFIFREPENSNDASNGTLSQYCDQLDYLKSKVGPDCVGIGSDFFGGPQGDGLKDVRCFPDIFAELLARGWSETDLKKLAGGNLLRVFRAVEKAAGRA
jgi:membrane dipeptidase